MMKGLSLFTLSFLSVFAHSKGEEDPLTESNNTIRESFDRQRDKLLQEISELTSGVSEAVCINISSSPLKEAAFDTRRFSMLKERVDLMSLVLENPSRDFTSISKREKQIIIRSLLESSPEMTAISLYYMDGSRVCEEREFGPLMSRSELFPHRRKPCIPLCFEGLHDQPWFGKWANPRIFQGISEQTSPKVDMKTSTIGLWTLPYFKCCQKRWMVSYVKAMYSKGKREGFLTASLDVSGIDINQCDWPENSSRSFSSSPDMNENYINYFRGTHKCHSSSYCDPIAGFGWKVGGYDCICKPGFYSKSNDTFEGSHVEVAWKTKYILGPTSAYNYLYKCLPCPEGCDPNNCNEKPCMAEYSWPFRITLLTFSCICILLTVTMMALVYKMRSMKVFKMASPTFLQICLFGCIIMYLEMAAIFPVLDVYFCVFTKWSRHMGFCITFSSLLMKTWRVSLTYRVKSAHKIKLTDKQLLQWMTPIVLIMGVYLSAWTISDAPGGTDAFDQDGLRFIICDYNTWDHAIALGEIIFLLWGVKVCYGVRKAESYFDEAKCISFAVYNITIVNIIMASIHLYIYHDAGPDIKYFFGFLRTQLGTSTTIALVFGPKFYRVLKGTGDELDSKYRSSGTRASFSINGLGGSSDQPHDVHEENEELKEEIQKLAAQIEFMKIVHMETNNRHLKPRSGGYFCEKNALTANFIQSGQSPSVNKNPVTKAERYEQERFSSESEIATDRV